LGLGIVGLIQKERKKIFAILGTIFSLVISIFLLLLYYFVLTLYYIVARITQCIQNGMADNQQSERPDQSIEFFSQAFTAVAYFHALPKYKIRRNLWIPL
jgi:hypothetical protein